MSGNSRSPVWLWSLDMYLEFAVTQLERAQPGTGAALELEPHLIQWNGTSSLWSRARGFYIDLKIAQNSANERLRGSGAATNQSRNHALVLLLHWTVPLQWAAFSLLECDWSSHRLVTEWHGGGFVCNFESGGKFTVRWRTCTEFSAVRSLCVKSSSSRRTSPDWFYMRTLTALLFTTRTLFCFSKWMSSPCAASSRSSK